MDLQFFHQKLFQHLNRFTFFMLHTGYDTYKFLTDCLTNLSQRNGSVYIVNVADSIIDKINKEGIHKIYKTETAKRYTMYTQKDVKFLLSSKVLLLDLISNKITPNLIDYLIIGDMKVLESDSKELFIIKYLLNQENNSNKFIVFNSFPNLFLNNLGVIVNSINNVNMIKEANFNFVPRNHSIIDKIIKYSFNLKSIQLFEHNLMDARNHNLEILLINFYNHCLEEIIRINTNEILIEKQKFKLKCLEILKIENIVNRNSNYIINTFSRIYAVNYKTKVLIKDLFNIVKLLSKLEYYDLPSILYNFNKIIKLAEEDSIFNYKDFVTLDLIEAIQNDLKSKIFKITKKDNNQISLITSDANHINDTIIYDDFKKVFDLNENNLNILRNYSFEIEDFIDISINNKARKIIEIFKSYITNKVKDKKVLIYTNNQYYSEILVEVLASIFIIKDNGITFFEKKLRQCLFSKMEYLKRKAILKYFENNTTHNSYIENLLLHKATYDLVGKLDKKFFNIFEKIALSQNAKEEETLASEIEVNPEEYYLFDETAYNVTNIIDNCFIFVENLRDPIQFEEFLIKNAIDTVIFYSFETEKIRLLESLISQKSEVRVKEIHILNSIDRINFRSEIINTQNEFRIFRKIYNDFNTIKYQDSDVKMEESIELDNKISEETNNSKLDAFNAIKSDKINLNIVVDHREMSSQVPFYLYDFGFNIKTGMIEVGDYITSNMVCIERKSITTGDLFESLKTSRLTNQAIKMKNYFEHNIILLEFEGELSTIISTNNRKFFKQNFMYKNFAELRAYSNKIHFVWSYNPKMTAKLLYLIKTTFKDHLDVQKCLNINKAEKIEHKRPSSQQTNNHTIFSLMRSKNNIAEAEQNNEFSQVVRELEKRYEADDLNTSSANIKKLDISVEKFLRRVDGIVNENINFVFKNFTNTKEFIIASKEKLQDIFGKTVASKIFFYFTKKHTIAE